MVIHVDIASFKVMLTGDPNVFRFTLYYTKDTFENGWEATWHSLTIDLNKNAPELIDAKVAEEINRREQNTAAATVEAWLAANKGETVVRVDPEAVPEPALGEAAEKPMYVVVVTP